MPSRSWLRASTEVAAFSLGTFLFLCIARREVVFDPPYQDQIYSWDEALFLAETNFDYYGLCVEESKKGLETRAVYIVTILPTVWALFLKTTCDVQSAFAMAHLLNFAFAAWCADSLRRMLEPSAGRLLACFAAAAALSMPVVIHQIDMIGLYIPMMAFCLAAVRAFAAKRLLLSSLYGFLAFACKVMALLLTLSLTLGCAWLWLRGGAGRPARRLAAAAFCLNSALAALELGLMLWSSPPSGYGRAMHPSLDAMNYWFLLRLCPDLAALLALAVVASTALVVCWVRGRRTPSDFERRLLAIACVFSALTLAAQHPFPSLPRYTVPVVPLLVVVVAVAAGGWRPARRIAASVFLAWTAFNLANAHGAFYPDTAATFRDYFERYPMFDARHCAFTERSLEYLDDHRRTIAGLRATAMRFPGRPILVPEPYQRAVRSTGLGYVTVPMEPHLVANMKAGWPVIRDLVRNGSTQSVIGMACRQTRIYLPQPQSTEAVFYDDGGSPSIRYYEIPLPAPSIPESELLEWYLDASWSEAFAPARALMRENFLLSLGEFDLAARERRRLTHSSPVHRP